MSDASTKKRERIMMSMASLAVVYMLFSLMLPSGKQEDKQPATPAAVDMLATISQGMDGLADKESVKSAEVLALAAVPWQNVALTPTEDIAEDTAGDTGHDTQPPATLAYTGYMGMGKGRLAIINGKDYQQGERVEGYVVKEITPVVVVLEKNGASVRLNIQTPME